MNFNRFLIILYLGVWLIETIFVLNCLYVVYNAEKFWDQLPFILIIIGLLLEIMRLNIVERMLRINININKKGE